MLYGQCDYALLCYESDIPISPNSIAPRLRKKSYMDDDVDVLQVFNQNLKSISTVSTTLSYIPKLVLPTRSILGSKGSIKYEKKQCNIKGWGSIHNVKMMGRGIGNCFAQETNLSTQNTDAPSTNPYPLCADKACATHSPSQMRDEQGSYINETSSTYMHFPEDADPGFENKCLSPLVLTPSFTENTKSCASATLYNIAKVENENIHRPNKIKNDENKAHITPLYTQQSQMPQSRFNEDIAEKEQVQYATEKNQPEISTTLGATTEHDCTHSVFFEKNKNKRKRRALLSTRDTRRTSLTRKNSALAPKETTITHSNNDDDNNYTRKIYPGFKRLDQRVPKEFPTQLPVFNFDARKSDMDWNTVKGFKALNKIKRKHIPEEQADKATEKEGGAIYRLSQKHARSTYYDNDSTIKAINRSNQISDSGNQLDVDVLREATDTSLMEYKTCNKSPFHARSNNYPIDEKHEESKTISPTLLRSVTDINLISPDQDRTIINLCQNMHFSDAPQDLHKTINYQQPKQHSRCMENKIFPKYSSLDPSKRITASSQEDKCGSYFMDDKKYHQLSKSPSIDDIIVDDILSLRSSDLGKITSCSYDDTNSYPTEDMTPKKKNGVFSTNFDTLPLAPTRLVKENKNGPAQNISNMTFASVKNEISSKSLISTKIDAKASEMRENNEMQQIINDEEQSISSFSLLKHFLPFIDDNTDCDASYIFQQSSKDYFPEEGSLCGSLDQESPFSSNTASKTNYMFNLSAKIKNDLKGLKVVSKKGPPPSLIFC
mmetsp:Transcript_20553/g.25198  ORF Transcript_20553/g.25198 Transcript_20553/m.25198 type:complete len:775 (-) Transcript_20553:96-2420(-)|eukprot:CAMPEP_0194386332 /NCGR_PEP_ID=MMETSP0174-20130528/85690_1 /TAXON_ID=216777 /ORGANISM="Proboscia alata, Strain PI-D3" /LENGTH=774 /DNA_ID=CAMNT_0039175393 /DNA_START=75 /DNA_END=2399 /DNA_ORIENTATION=-